MTSYNCNTDSFLFFRYCQPVAARSSRCRTRPFRCRDPSRPPAPPRRPSPSTPRQPTPPRASSKSPARPRLPCLTKNRRPRGGCDDDVICCCAVRRHFGICRNPNQTLKGFKWKLNCKDIILLGTTLLLLFFLFLIHTYYILSKYPKLTRMV